jgi:hypothetical protein
VRHARNDTPVRHARNDTPVRHARNDTPVRHARNDTPVRHARNDTPVRHARNDTPIRLRALLYIEYLYKNGQMIARVHDPVRGRGASHRAPYHQVPS